MKKISKSTVLAVLLFVLVVSISVYSARTISQDVTQQQKEIINNAVTRSAVQCYAIEGAYPIDIEYLEDNYSLRYDDENFVVHYSYVGGNLLPEIAVFYIGDN